MESHIKDYQINDLVQNVNFNILRNMFNIYYERQMFLDTGEIYFREWHSDFKDYLILLINNFKASLYQNNDPLDY